MVMNYLKLNILMEKGNKRIKINNNFINITVVPIKKIWIGDWR